jgi:hypothetical protein
MSLCSRHKHSEKNGLFAPEKLNIGPFYKAKLAIIILISDTSRGPTPFVNLFSTRIAVLALMIPT